MNKLLISFAILATFTVSAQDKASSLSTSTTTTSSLTGSLTTGAVVGGTVAAGVVAAVVTNSDGATDPIIPEKTLKCEGTDPLVNGVCVRTSATTSVTKSGTGTATKTITLPVTATYAPTLQ